MNAIKHIMHARGSRSYACVSIVLALSSMLREVMAVPCRDRFLEPFSADSIWNTAIGSQARFEPANLFAPGDYRGEPGNFHNDQDFIVRVSPSDPITDWINQGDWGGDDHCAVQQHSRTGVPCSAIDSNLSKQLDGCVAQIRLPRNWTSASDCIGGPAKSDASNCYSKGNQSNNNAMAVLLEDNVTLVQMQPAYRCGFYPDPILARWGNITDGGPQRFANITSILGDGIGGAHGGSGLSSVGGTIRLGELLPDAPPIKHALKIELANWWYYGASQLNPSTIENGGRTQYTWPATGSNGGWSNVTNTSSANYLGTNKYVVPGALLAIPATSAGRVNTKTVIGSKIKDAMINYGAYIVDGTGQGPGTHMNTVAICMDAAVNSEMRSAYNFSMAYPHGVGGPWNAEHQTTEENDLYSDLLAIFRALYAVTNNSPENVGGGGTPRQPRKGPICGVGI
eukprot:g1700.t1